MSPLLLLLASALSGPTERIHALSPCIDCHASHEPSMTDLVSPTVLELCVRCHKREMHAGAAEHLDVVMEEERARRARAQGLVLPADNVISCTTCHEVHIDRMEFAERPDPWPRWWRGRVLEPSYRARSRGGAPLDVRTYEPERVNVRLVAPVLCLACHDAAQADEQAAKRRAAPPQQ